jgi:alkaline phosphatase D
MKNQITLFALFILLFYSGYAFSSEEVYFTTGFKIGEITDTSMFVWTRLCKMPEPVPVHHQRKEPPFRSPLNFNEDMPVNEMDGAVEGSFGQVKITLNSEKENITTAWRYVSGYKDFTVLEQFTGLTPNTEYRILIQGRKDENSPVAEIRGSFKTAPSIDEIIPVSFTSTSCQYFWDFDDSIRGFKTYDSMLKLEPAFHCQTGDFVYYDKPGPISNSVELARHKWHAMNAWPSLVDFYSRVPLYIQKDDHDMLKDDAYPQKAPLGELSFNDGLNIWHEQVPLQGKPYRTMRWGKDLQIWFVEGREYRSENEMEDGPDKSIWGDAQKRWFVETMESSDASFKILMSPTPVVGPDRIKGKNDNHANAAYKTEGDWLRKFMSAQKNAFVVNGDRHWQYVSKDPVSGLMEFSQGPTSDEHAQGWKQDDYRPEHRFLRVKGGFLLVSVYREKGTPTIRFSHYDVDGNEVHQETFKAL